MKKIRVILPHHLRSLAKVGREVEVRLDAEATIGAVLSAVENSYPVLKGTIRDHDTLRRRAFVRFFACGEDVSLKPYETPLPQDIADGREPFMVVGAIAGG